MTEAAHVIAQAMTELREAQEKRNAVSERNTLLAISGVVIVLISFMAALAQGHADNHRTQRERIKACRTIEEPANRALCLTN